MKTEACDHRQIRVDGVSQRNTLVAFDDAVIGICPSFCFLRVDETKGQGSKPISRSYFDRPAVSARYPHGGMRLLHGLRNHVSAWHRKPLTLVSGVWLHHQHVRYLSRSFQGQRTLPSRVDVVSP